MKFSPSGMKIRAFADADLLDVASVHAQAFPRQLRSREWIACNAQAFPRIRYYVAEDSEGICGFICWTEKSGFRADVVLELEQIAVLPPHQRQGIGESLIRQSLPLVADALAALGSTLSSIIVTTRADNAAQKLYARVLGAKVLAVIPALYSADEVIMGARKPLLALQNEKPEAA